MDGIDQFIFKRRVAVDRLVNGSVERHNSVDTTNVVAKAIYKRSVFVKQGAKCVHVVGIPDSLKCSGHIFWFDYSGHWLVALALLRD